MQLAYRHDERPGESYEALDGKKGAFARKPIECSLSPPTRPYGRETNSEEGARLTQDAESHVSKNKSAC